MSSTRLYRVASVLLVLAARQGASAHKPEGH
jgi:hypothetical protein